MSIEILNDSITLGGTVQTVASIPDHQFHSFIFTAEDGDMRVMLNGTADANTGVLVFSGSSVTLPMPNNSSISVYGATTGKLYSVILLG